MATSQRSNLDLISAGVAFFGLMAVIPGVASVVALLLWLYLPVQIFLLGGALNAELEFFSVGKTVAPVEKDETIEPTVSITGGKKEVATRPNPVATDSSLEKEKSA